MVDTEFAGPLPITHDMLYFDTHLHYLKETKGFKPSFVFIDHQPDLVCKIAAIELDSRMYSLGVSTNSLSDWVNRVQNQFSHVLTQGSKLDESGDWDQQANWTNRGTPLSVRDDKLGSEALLLKEEEIVNVMASNSSSAARKLQVAVAIALQSVNNKKASNANCE